MAGRFLKTARVWTLVELPTVEFLGLAVALALALAPGHFGVFPALH